MIEGYLPGLVRVDPVGVAPAEVVALALRCERLEAVADAAREYREAAEACRHPSDDPPGTRVMAYIGAENRLDAALVAAGATGKAGT